MELNNIESNILPNGKEAEIWSDKTVYTRTYYVDCKHPLASDGGMGTKEAPFLTINYAAQVVKAGERVVIAGGLYRESIHPLNEGKSSEQMICYQAAEGEEVIIKGSVAITEGWERSTGWKLKGENDCHEDIWQISLKGLISDGYNPFGTVNVLQDRFWLFHKKINMDPFFKRRGMVFIDGVPLKQVELFHQLGEFEGAFWIEHNGMTLHIRFPQASSPEQHETEITVKEQLFMPAKRGLGYIRVSGLKMIHAANGFPVPQRGLLSTNRGHHWIIENNTIKWANSVGLDTGNECWNADRTNEVGGHIIRANVVDGCGICGLAAFIAPNLVVEDNIFENCGWHDAEHMYESAGVKFHVAKNLLFRRNIVRNIKHATGLWFDCTNSNCRVTGNLFYNITSRASAIQFEATHEENIIDNNIISGVKAQCNLEGVYGSGGHGIEADGSDKLLITQNIIAECENAGFFADTVADRIVDGRGGTARGHCLYKNIFHKCGRAAIEFANEYNASNGNLFSDMPDGYLRIGTPTPRELLDLSAWREFHQWEKNGENKKLNVEITSNGNVNISNMYGELICSDMNSSLLFNSDINNTFILLTKKGMIDSILEKLRDENIANINIFD